MRTDLILTGNDIKAVAGRITNPCYTKYEVRVISAIRFWEEKTVKMDVSIEDEKWDAMTHEQKNHELFLRQKALLDQFLEKGAISREQHDKSLHDLTEKMHEVVD